jgi:glucose/arabinose dehydrogenase
MGLMRMRLGRLGVACVLAATCLPLDDHRVQDDPATGGMSGGGKGGSSSGTAGTPSGGKGGTDAGSGGQAGNEDAGSSGVTSNGGSSGSGVGGSSGSGGGSSGKGGGAQSGAGGDTSSGGDAGDGGTGGTGGSSGGTAGGGAGGASGSAGTGGGAGMPGVPCSGTVTAGFDIDPSYATGVTAATDVAFHADGRAVITQKSGSITIRRTDGTKAVVSGLFGTVDTASEKGLLGVVADPGVASNHKFYFYVSNGPSGDVHRVYSATLSSLNAFTLDATPIIAASRGNGPGLEGPANHDGGGLFIHENKLFVSVGDTGQNATPPQNKYGSCLNKPNGKILRVNLDGSIPSDNPLVGVSSVTACSTQTGGWTTAAPDERIYAWGFRNPWRFWIDPTTDLLWIGDVGETTREEISVGAGDRHYGWPFSEGTTDYPALGGQTCDSIVPARTCVGPVHDYESTSGASCVIGGLIPSGCGWENVWAGKSYYLFADWGGSWLHALEVNPARNGMVGDVIDLGSLGASSAPASLRMGPDEALYVVMNQAGGVYRITPKSRCGPSCP